MENRKTFCVVLDAVPEQQNQRRQSAPSFHPQIRQPRTRYPPVVCAQSLLVSRSALGAYCRRMCARLGKPKGIIAAAHKLALLVYRMLKFGRRYVDIGQEQYEEKYKERALKQL